MSKGKILVVDDEPAIVDLVSQVLWRQGYEVFSARDGDAGLAAVYDLRPALVVLDLMLPKLDGWEICRRVKADPEVRSTPILMLTARRDERDLVEGLNLGADDYVRKPFSTAELSARVAAILRRYSGESEELLTCGELQVDLRNESALLRGRELKLSVTEFRLLERLAERFERNVTRESLLSYIWSTSDCESRAIDVYISRLRRKLDDGGSPAYRIQSQRGRGYKLLEDRAEAGQGLDPSSQEDFE